MQTCMLATEVMASNSEVAGQASITCISQSSDLQPAAQPRTPDQPTLLVNNVATKGSNHSLLFGSPLGDGDSRDDARHAVLAARLLPGSCNSCEFAGSFLSSSVAKHAAAREASAGVTTPHSAVAPSGAACSPARAYKGRARSVAPGKQPPIESLHQVNQSWCQLFSLKHRTSHYMTLTLSFPIWLQSQQHYTLWLMGLTCRLLHLTAACFKQDMSDAWYVVVILEFIIEGSTVLAYA